MNVVMKKVHLAYVYSHKIIKDFFTNSYYYSIPFAYYNFLWWIFFFVRTSLSWRITSYAIRKKTIYLDRHLENKYGDILNKYRNLKKGTKPLKSDYTIWVYWGQGENNMPPLVKACYKQLIHYNSNVQLITNTNIDSYIQLPPEIFQKVKAHKIGWANYSDIIRNALLTKYGGLWLDATVWVAKKVPLEQLQTLPLFTANSYEKQTNRSIRFWSSFEWNWSSWCLWARESNNLFFSFVSEMLQNIAIREKKWPDYVIQDYLFYYACRYFPSVREEMENITIHTPNKDKLASLMNLAFDEGVYNELIKNEFAFKLRYRTPWKPQTSRGECTFYGRILKGII